MDRKYNEKNTRKVLEYEICGMLGEGATGRVYRVKERISGKVYACKVSGFTQRMEEEAKLLRTLEHPLFPGYIDYFEADEKSYLIMECIAGSNLQSHLRRRGGFSQRETIRIVTELADGLGVLHERYPAVIYRDIKPANIILQPDGRARLLDLGAAAAPVRWRVGTIGYAAPEQRLVAGNEREVAGSLPETTSLQPSCDIYGLGMLMHHMLTGHDPLQIRDLIMPVRRYNPKINRGIEDIVHRCITQRQEERIPGMRELVHELSEYYNKTSLQRYIRDIKAYLTDSHRPKVIYNKNIWLSRYKA